MKSFRDKLSFEERRASYEQQRKRHPDKVFVVGDRHSKSQMPACQSIKFVCDSLQKLHVIRRIIAKRVLPKTHPDLKNLEPEIAIYIYCGNRLLNGEETMLEIQQKYQNKDGYLYLEFSEMETFG